MLLPSFLEHFVKIVFFIYDVMINWHFNISKIAPYSHHQLYQFTNVQCFFIDIFYCMFSILMIFTCCSIYIKDKDMIGEKIMLQKQNQHIALTYQYCCLDHCSNCKPTVD
ncbi:unnamed protein product [Heterobilharzia americana]|nr:unnamed protein product [Heterobilharzia americana]